MNEIDWAPKGRAGRCITLRREGRTADHTEYLLSVGGKKHGPLKVSYGVSGVPPFWSFLPPF